MVIELLLILNGFSMIIVDCYLNQFLWPHCVKISALMMIKVEVESTEKLNLI